MKEIHLRLVAQDTQDYELHFKNVKLRVWYSC